MSPGGRSRDVLVTAAFLVVVGVLVGVGWLTREPAFALARGAPAPALELPLMRGGTASLDSLRGKVVLLNVWATWCLPCVREMPSIQRVYEAYADRGLEVLAVAVDDHPGTRQTDGRVEGVVSRFVEELGLTFPVALDPTGGTERSLGTEYLPTTVLIDRQGYVRAREVGGRFWDQEPYIDMVGALLEED
jgi:thiol-disulfide isomerase/thioredoxin